MSADGVIAAAGKNNMEKVDEIISVFGRVRYTEKNLPNIIRLLWHEHLGLGLGQTAQPFVFRVESGHQLGQLRTGPLLAAADVNPVKLAVKRRPEGQKCCILHEHFHGCRGRGG